jgi:hypothetical protein
MLGCIVPDVRILMRTEELNFGLLVAVLTPTSGGRGAYKPGQKHGMLATQ